MNHVRHRLTHLLRKPFLTREGRIVVAQVPNPPMLTAILGFLISIMSQGWLMILAEVAGIISLGYWAILEVSQGVNAWRKALGIAGLLWLLGRLM